MIFFPMFAWHFFLIRSSTYYTQHTKNFFLTDLTFYILEFWYGASLLLITILKTLAHLYPLSLSKALSVVISCLLCIHNLVFTSIFFPPDPLLVHYNLSELS
jgi:hypothetical protein